MAIARARCYPPNRHERRRPGRQGDGPIIVFDAMCVLCSANAAFVLRHDRTGRFRLASMQSPVGAELYRRFGIDPADPETLIVVEGDSALRDSDAVLAIWAGLPRPGTGWRCCAPCRARSAIRSTAGSPAIATACSASATACWVPTAEQARRIL